jgi:xylan 1,4-beta-xylosidase
MEQTLLKRQIIPLLITAIVSLSFQAQAQPNKVTTTNYGNSYNNPIIPGFNPDPSICRVGKDYYLATSTFEYFPGVPIYHSLDLVHWTMIGHCLQRPSQLNLDSVSCSGGIFAPTLRWNKGTFYMITTLVGGKNPFRGDFIVSAKNPAGPWSEPHWIADAPGIDPSLFFDDDGKVYCSGNNSPKIKLWDKHRNIWVQEIDLNTWKLTGKRVDVVDGSEYYEKGTLGSVSNYEGAHIYKKDGQYYLMVSHGGTSHNHAVSIWKSKNIFGPYEINPANPILTRRDMPIVSDFTSTGHADLVQTQKGEWWIVYLAKRPYGGENFILGRETFMSPVNWSGIWPVVNPAGKVGKGALIQLKPDLKEDKKYHFFTRDDFNDKILLPQWTFIRTPRSQWWSLSNRNGFLRLQLRPDRIQDQTNPSFIGIRQGQINTSATVKMEFVPASDKEEAGLVVERDKDNYFKFTLTLEAGQTCLRLVKGSSDQLVDEPIAKSVVQSGSIYLKITSESVNYSFSYSFDRKNWKIIQNQVDGRLLGMAGAGRFTGTFIGMYASSNGSTCKNYADFDWFDKQ